MKRAQITGQIFIYIMVIVVVGLIALIGYNYVGKIMVAKCNADRVQFVKTVEDYAEKFDGYNELQRRAIVAPCDTDVVCFIDSLAINDSDFSTDINDPVIRNSVNAGVEQNVFLVGDKTEAIGFISKIRVHNDDRYICINKTGNKINVKFMGDSEYTAVDTY